MRYTWRLRVDGENDSDSDCETRGSGFGQIEKVRSEPLSACADQTHGRISAKLSGMQEAQTEAVRIYNAETTAEEQ